jgi:acetyl-CoA decarbonylase/synthase complex subunit delta
MDGGSAADVAPIAKRLDDVESIDLAALAPAPDLTIEEEKKAAPAAKAAPKEGRPKAAAKPAPARPQAGRGKPSRTGTGRCAGCTGQSQSGSRSQGQGRCRSQGQSRSGGQSQGRSGCQGQGGCRSQGQGRKAEAKAKAELPPEAAADREAPKPCVKARRRAGKGGPNAGRRRQAVVPMTPCRRSEERAGKTLEKLELDSTSVYRENPIEPLTLADNQQH